MLNILEEMGSEWGEEFEEGFKLSIQKIEHGW